MRNHKWTEVVPGFTSQSTLQVCVHCGTFRSMEEGRYYKGLMMYAWKHSRLTYDVKKGFDIEFVKKVKCTDYPVPFLLYATTKSK